jgi:hypothetical protein
MGGVQIIVERKVDAITFGVERQDGVFTIHLRKWSKLLGPLCAKLQWNVDNGPFERGIY